MVNIESIQVVVSLLEEKDWQFLDFISYEAKIGYLTSFANKKIEEIKAALEKKQNTYTDRIISKIVDNLHLNFKNLHIRIEEPNYSPYFSFGITMESLNVVNTDKDWKEKFIDRNVDQTTDMFKLLKLNNLGFYFKINETYLLSKLETKREVQDEMFKCFPDGSKVYANGNYLILPMTLEAKLKQIMNINSIANKDSLNNLNNDAEAKNNLWIYLENFNIDFSKQQYNSLSRLMNHISNYQKFQLNYYNTRKFQKFKPKETLSKENYNKWFKWAIRMTVLKQKFINGEKDVFNMPLLIKTKLESDFKKLLYKFLKSEINTTENSSNKTETTNNTIEGNNLDNKDLLSSTELVRFKFIVTTNELNDLYMWSVPIIESIYKERKVEINKKSKTGFMSIFSAKPKEEELKITEDEEIKILEILDKTKKEVQQVIEKSSDMMNLRVDFKLNSGFFKFYTEYSSKDNTWSEGFKFHYKALHVSSKNGDLWSEVESQLKEFHIDMFSEVNKNITVVPITFTDNVHGKDIISSRNAFRRLSMQDFDDKNYKQVNYNKEIIKNDTNNSSNYTNKSTVDDYVWKIRIKNNEPDSSINSQIEGRVKSLNLFYHQVLLERILAFFTSKTMNEDVKTQAYDKWVNFKESTQASLKEVLQKKNIVILNIEPRIIVVPINKYNIKNSKVLSVEIGDILMHNSSAEKYYSEKYNLVITKVNLAYFYNFDDFKINKGRYNIINDLSMLLTISALNASKINVNEFNKNKDDNDNQNIINDNPIEIPAAHILPKILLTLTFNKVTINLTDYLFTILEYLIDVFKPVKENDMWASINESSEEIKKNSICFGKVLKKNFYQNLKEYYAVLYGGYIYFFDNYDSQEYSGYYYIKDSEIEDSGKGVDGLYSINLKSKYGSIDLKINREAKYLTWKNSINERILEMKTSFDERTKEVGEENNAYVTDLIKNADLKEFFFGLTINVKEVGINIYEVKNLIDNTIIDGSSSNNNDEISNINSHINISEYDNVIDIADKNDTCNNLINNAKEDNELDIEDEEYYSGEEINEIENKYKIGTNDNSNNRRLSKRNKKNSIVVISEFNNKIKDSLNKLKSKNPISIDNTGKNNNSENTFKKDPSFLVNVSNISEVKLFSAVFRGFYMKLNCREMDVELDLELSSLDVYDEVTSEKDLNQMISSVPHNLIDINNSDKNDIDGNKRNINNNMSSATNKSVKNRNQPFFSLKVRVLDESSPYYNGTQIDITIEIDYVSCIWNPLRLKKLLAILAHNDILRSKVWREIECPTEELLEKKFVDKGKQEESLKLTCVATKYIYIKLNCVVKDINIVWVQPIKEFMFIEVSTRMLSLDLIMTVDHLIFGGSIGKTEISDLSNYPYTISSQKEFNYKNKRPFLVISEYKDEDNSDKENDSANYDKKDDNTNKNDDNSSENDPEKLNSSTNSKNTNTNRNKRINDKLLSFNYESYSEWCPHCKGQYTSACEVELNNPTLTYYHEFFLRFFNYLISEFIGSMPCNEETKNFKNEQYKIVSKDVSSRNMDLMTISCVIKNPKGILKARPCFNEFFEIYFGDININAVYQLLPNRILSDKSELRWAVTYKLDMNELSLKSSDGFSIIEPIKIEFNMHFSYFTLEDLKKSDLEVDKSFQIDLIIEELVMNLRQKDFTNLLKCSDLNILYSDMMYEDYYYEPVIEANTNIDYLGLNDKNEERKTLSKLKNEMYSMLFIVLAKKINLNLFLKDKPLAEIVLYEKELNFFKKLNNLKECYIVISKIEFYEYTGGYCHCCNNNPNKNCFEYFDENKEKENKELEMRKCASYNVNNNLMNKRNSSNNNERRSFQFNNNINLESKKTSKKNSFNDLNIENDCHIMSDEKQYSLHKELFLSDFKKKDNNTTHKFSLNNNLNSKSSINKNSSSNLEVQQKNTNKTNTTLNTKEDIIIEEREDIEFISHKLIKKPQAIEKRGLQIEAKITIEENYEKHYQVNLNNIKVIFKINTLNLIRYFFIEGFPYYDHYNKDKPNFYDPNEDNYPGYKFYLEINNPLIAFLTSNSSSNSNSNSYNNYTRNSTNSGQNYNNNKNFFTHLSQKAICISTDIVLGYKKQKIKTAKEELQGNLIELTKLKQTVNDKEQIEYLERAINEDKSDIYNFSITFNQLSPFICDKEILFTDIEIPKRKIIDSFNLKYHSNYYIKRINDDNYYVVFNSGVDIKKFTMKISYKDFVMLLKAYKYNISLINEEYNNKLKQLIYYTDIKKLVDDKNELIDNSELPIISDYGDIDAEIIKKLIDDDNIIDTEGLNNNITINNAKNSADTLSLSNKNISNEQINNMIINPLSTSNKSRKNRRRITIINSETNNEDDNDVNEEDQETNSTIKINKNKDNNYINNNSSSNSKHTSSKNATITDKGMGELNFQIEELNLILIDDQAETFYPFLCFDLSQFSFNQVFNSYCQNNITILTLIKGLIYNYLAGNWEPLIEKTELEIQYSTDTSDSKRVMNQALVCIPFSSNVSHKDTDFGSFNNNSNTNNSNGPNIGLSSVNFNYDSSKNGFSTSHNRHILNINLSDLTLVFLYKSLTRWQQKYNLFMNEMNNQDLNNNNGNLGNSSINRSRTTNNNNGYHKLNNNYSINNPSTRSSICDTNKISENNNYLKRDNTFHPPSNNYLNSANTFSEDIIRIDVNKYNLPSENLQNNNTEKVIISNHMITNHSGCLIKLYKVFKKDKLKFHKQMIFLTELNENFAYNLEYFDDAEEALNIEPNKSLLKENYIFFKILSLKNNNSEIICSAILKIDNLQIKLHSIDRSQEIKSLKMNPKVEKYQYLVSEVKFDSLKKKIFIYSPINIENNTNVILNITLCRKNLSNYMFFLEPGNVVGIPFEYLDGIMEIEYDCSNTLSFGVLDFLKPEALHQILKFNNNNSFSLNSDEWKKPYRVLAVNHCYTIRNHLPFDATINVSHLNEGILIAKGEKAYVNQVSNNGIFEMGLSFLDFKTKTSLSLFKEANNKNNNKKSKDKDNNSNNILSPETFTVSVFDSLNREAIICVSVVNPNDKVIVLYCSGVLVNETVMNIKFYYLNKKDKKIELAGQTTDIANVLPLSNEKKIILNCDGYESKAYSTTSIGITTLVECVKKDKKYEFIMGGKLSLVAEDLDIYCEILTFSPKFILFNQLKYPLIVKVENNRKSEILRPEEKQAFYFFGKSSESKLTLRPVDSYASKDLSQIYKRLNSVNKNRGNDSILSNITSVFDGKNNNNSGDEDLYKWTESREFVLTEESLLTLAFRVENSYLQEKNRLKSVDVFEKKNDINANDINSDNSKSNRFYINLEKKVFGNSTFIVISEANLTTSNFVIENHSFTSSMKIWQSGTSPEYINIRSKKIIAFDSTKSILNMQFLHGNLNNQPLVVADSIKKIRLDDSLIVIYETEKVFNENTKHIEMKEKLTELIYPANCQFKFNTSKNKGFSLIANFHTDGLRKKIEFYDFNCDILASPQTTINIIEFQLFISHLGISIIGDNKNIEKQNNKYHRYEVAYIAIENLVYFTKQESSGNNAFRSETQIQIKELQINNEFTYVTQFPVILRAINSKKDALKGKKKNKEIEDSLSSKFPPFLNIAFALERTEQETTTRVVLFNYLLQSAFLNLDSEIIEKIINFFNNIIIELKTSISQIHPVFISLEENLKNNIFIKDNYLSPVWYNQNSENNKSGKLFIQTLELSPIEILFSFTSNAKSKVFSKYITNNPLLSGVMSTVSNLELATIRLNGTNIHNVYANGNELFTLVANVYKEHFLMQIMKMFGAIDILGNPVNLVHNLGTGVSDFFQKPAKGIIKGPLEGIVGVVGKTYLYLLNFLLIYLDGTVSLMKHTIGGTFQAASKISSGLSKGMLYFTSDDDYISKREKKKITERPKNFVEGLGYGVFSVASGVYHGITDIVAKPIEGVQNNNSNKLKGFGKGLLQGLTGVIVKPMAGVLDMVSKTTEGIKNTVKEDVVMILDRLPRPFYGKFKLIRTYNLYHSQVIEVMNTKIKNGIDTYSFDFYSSEIYKSDSGNSVLIIFSTTTLYFIDLSAKELKVTLHYNDIKDIYLETENKIRIIFKKAINEKLNSKITISKNYNNAKHILVKIKEAIENNYEDYSLPFDN